jgi:Holliday junction resolvase RusA-like endonuclease
MKSITFFIAGQVKGQPRPKATRRGNHAGVYDPGTADGWKLLVRHEADKVKPLMPLEGALYLSITAYFPRPKSHFSARGELKDGMPFLHTSKPDADNIAKAIMDALTNLGTYWRDDSQVAYLRIEKRYAAINPGALVKISQREEGV